MHLLPTLLLLGGVLAEVSTPDGDAIRVCQSLMSKYSNQVAWDPKKSRPQDATLGPNIYDATLMDYWNAESVGNRPRCIFQPSSAEQVSFAVRMLVTYSNATFALKSGGHNPNVGFSSVNGGVLLAFRPNLQTAVPAPDGNTIDVGAGCKWEDVYAALEPLGKVAVGSRLGDVGVTGFILGGGLSYLSAQYGFGCDNVVSFECVLADGSIVEASATSHPELYFALRGGGNQYAIVTRMTLKTYDVGVGGRIWGGVRVYAGDKHSRLLSAVSNFTAKNRDPKAAIIPTFEFAGGFGFNVPVAVFLFFYDGLKPPAGVFDELDAVEALASNTGTRSFTSLTREILGGNMKGFRFQIGVNTFPNMPMPAMSAFLDDHYARAAEMAAAGAGADLVDVRLFSFAVQPMPYGIAAASARSGGGNALGLVPEHGDRVWVEYDVAWASRACDGSCSVFFMKALETLHDLHASKYAGIPPTNYKEGNVSHVSYNPIFMNDAMHHQPVLQSYGDDIYLRLNSTHLQYDPQGMFARRQGGFKFQVPPKLPEN